MLRLVADANVNIAIVTGLLARIPDADVIRLQESGLETMPDPEVLEWAANERRLVVTHDFETLVGFARTRAAAGQPMPGVVAVRQTAPVGRVIDDLALVLECSLEGEWEGSVLFLPF